MGRAVRDMIPAISRLSPRHALSAPEAALFVGIGETLFRELVDAGEMPQPREVRTRLLWDVDELILAFKSLPRKGEKRKGPNPWDAVEFR